MGTVIQVYTSLGKGITVRTSAVGNTGSSKKLQFSASCRKEGGGNVYISISSCPISNSPSPLFSKTFSNIQTGAFFCLGGWVGVAISICIIYFPRKAIEMRELLLLLLLLLLSVGHLEVITSNEIFFISTLVINIVCSCSCSLVGPCHTRRSSRALWRRVSCSALWTAWSGPWTGSMRGRARY